MTSSYLLSIDQGTTGSRVYIFDQASHLISKAYQEFRQYYPRPGWVEHDPLEILEVTYRVIKRALLKGRVSPKGIACIAITNQRETSVFWDKVSGKPLGRAIVWQDRRTFDLCGQLKKEGYQAVFKKKTGLLLDPYFSGTKIRWFFDHHPSARLRSLRGKVLFGTIDTWLLWNLTGGEVHGTDVTNASRTLLFNIKKKEWDLELISVLKIPTSCLPAVKNSADDHGVTRKSSFFPSGIPIKVLIGDQQSALYGQGCYKAGEMKNTYGTGCFLVLHTGQKFVDSKNGLLTTLCCDFDGKPAYALEGSVFIAGAAIQWIRDQMQFIKTAHESEKISRSLKDTGGVVVIPAFVGLGAPYWDSEARGAILGITRGTTRGQIVKATLESIAYETCDIFRAMQEDAGFRIHELKVDGGATSNRYLMQFQADLLGVPVSRSSLKEATVWGAAKLAGRCFGFWSPSRNLDTVRHLKKMIPRWPPSVREKRYQFWKSCVLRVLSRR